MPWKSFNFVDSFISRFRVEHIEGELAVSGRPISSHCPILILVFSGCFVIAGLVLTVLAYRPLTSSVNNYLRQLSGSHIAGPVLLVIGLVLVGIGLALQIVSQHLKKISRTEQSPRLKVQPVVDWLRQKWSRVALGGSSLKSTFRVPFTQSARHISKRRIVVRELLHNSVTTDSLSSNFEYNQSGQPGDIASFPPSNECLPV